MVLLRHILSHSEDTPDEQGTRRSLQKYDLNRKKLQRTSLEGSRTAAVELCTSYSTFWREGKWDHEAVFWIKAEWARCLLLVLLAQAYCQRHCASGDVVHPRHFWKVQHIFSQSDFISCSMGGTSDFTVDRQRSLFSPATILHFSGTLQFIWTGEGKKWNSRAIMQISMF